MFKSLKKKIVIKIICKQKYVMVSAYFGLMMLLSVPLTGFRQSVQPAGHPANSRHELQDSSRRLGVCNISHNKTVENYELESVSDCCSWIYCYVVLKLKNDASFSKQYTLFFCLFYL